MSTPQTIPAKKVENPKKRKFEDIAGFSSPEEMVTFIVGKNDNSKRFLVHKEIACLSSPIFKAAFNSQFIEGQTQTYKLEDTSDGVFKLLMQWMYSRKLKLATHEELGHGDFGSDMQLLNSFSDSISEEEFSDHGDICSDQDSRLVQLWILGERLLMDSLCNFLIDIMRTTSQICSVFEPKVVRYIYQNTAEGSPLRRLGVLQACGQQLQSYSKYPPMFLGDVINEMHVSTDVEHWERHLWVSRESLYLKRSEEKNANGDTVV